MGPFGWIIRNAGAIYMLVMTAIHAAEDAQASGPDKRNASVQSILQGLDSLGLPTTLNKIIGGVIGAMIDVYVGVKNVLQGHGWYGLDGTAQAAAQALTGAQPADPGNIAQADQAARANATLQANQQLRTADVGPAPAAPKPGTTGYKP